MLKQMLLIGAAVMSFPALAQTAPTGDEPATPPAQTETAPDSPVSPGEPAPNTTAPPPTDEIGVKPAPSGATEISSQVMQIVNQEFPTYDANSSGELNEVEFATWMTKLRTANAPSVDPESEQVKNWIGQASAAADTDKSGGISKEELTNFLSRGI